MIFTARLLALLTVIFFTSGCAVVRFLAARNAEPAANQTEPLPPGALLPSRNLLVGRVLAVDLARRFAIVDLASDAPGAALADGAELLARTDALRETARLRASRYVRERTLGATIISGQPSPGDEVVFPAP